MMHVWREIKITGILQPCGQAADHPRQRCNGFDTKFAFLAKGTWVSWQDPSCKGNMEPSRPDHLVDTARFCIEPVEGVAHDQCDFKMSTSLVAGFVNHTDGGSKSALIGGKEPQQPTSFPRSLNSNQILLQYRLFGR